MLRQLSPAPYGLFRLIFGFFQEYVSLPAFLDPMLSTSFIFFLGSSMFHGCRQLSLELYLALRVVVGQVDP
jgi:hypothetical protein